MANDRTCQSCGGSGKDFIDNPTTGRLLQTNTCWNCNGKGKKPAKSQTCPTCHGRGEIDKDYCSATGFVADMITGNQVDLGRRSMSVTCKTCGGDGKF